MSDKTEVIFKGKFIQLSVVNTFFSKNKTVTEETIKGGRAVAIIPTDETDTVYCIRQYRKAAEKVLLEIPAGRLENNEMPDDCAHRELAEETGLKAGSLVKICHFYTSPVISDELIYLYLATKLTPLAEPVEGDEIAEVVPLPLDLLIKKIKTGEIEDAKTIIGIMLYLSTRELIKKTANPLD